MSEQDRSSNTLINLMFDELYKLEDGASTPQQARAKSSVANTILATKRLEMDFARFVSDSRSNGESLSGPAPIAIASNSA